MAISLESIVSGRENKPPLVIMHGVGGIGKTTFAAGDPDLGIAGPPSPIFLMTVVGLGRLKPHRFAPVPGDPVIRSWAELIECVAFLYNEQHDHKTVVIDTIDGVERLIWAHLCSQYGQPKIDTNDKGSPFAFGRGYLYAVDEAGVLLRWLEALRNDRGMTAILLAHTETAKVDPPDSESYTEWSIGVHKRLTSRLYDWCDVCLFGQWKTHVVKDDDSRDPKKKRARGVGTGERVMYTERRPAWLAKNRYGLPPEMPLSWAALQEAIGSFGEAPNSTSVSPATA